MASERLRNSEDSQRYERKVGELLSKAGLSPNDVSTTGIGMGATAAVALEKGQVDAAVLFGSAVTALEARIPNLLINGSSGIAVGMATNIPPHNLNEVVDACLHMLRNPSASVRRRAQIAAMPSSLAWSIAAFRPITPAK